MRFIALWTGKITYIILRLLGKQGATLPGLVAEKIYPNILDSSLKNIDNGVVVIIGTNGKTTATKMLTHILSANMKVLSNPTGSNFTRGVVASIVKGSSWAGKLNFDIAVIELDEAYAVKFVEKHKPRYSLVLNVMRDQMDRFGEIDHTARLLEKVVKNTTDTVVLNADDPRVAKMSNFTQANTVYFGVSEDLRHIFINDDEMHGGTKRLRSNKLDAELLSVDNGQISVNLKDQHFKVNLPVIGLHNAQNATAVALMAKEIGENANIIKQGLSTTKPAFGRGEIISIGQKNIILQLVKNPGGFRQSLLSGSVINADITVIAINDDYADGRDVSWLWDVEFAGKLNTNGSIVTSGTRASDMALRLAYDDIAVSDIEPKLSTMLNNAILKMDDGQTMLIYTTYTAMLEIRGYISKMTTLEEI